MKQVNMVLRLAVGLAAGISLTSTWAHAGYNVVESGKNYRVLQTTTSIGGTNQIHRCIEVANGINYTNASGQWLAAQEQIAILPQGGAASRRGQVAPPQPRVAAQLVALLPDWKLSNCWQKLKRRPGAGASGVSPSKQRNDQQQ